MTQRRRRLFQGAFFALFLLAPALDLLRFDLTETQLWFLGQRWSLGIDALVRGEASAAQAAWGIVWRAFLPGLVLVGTFLAVARRYGRLYCGWLCPHFSSVEMLNDLLHRAIGKFSLWDRGRTPRAGRTPDRRYLPLFLLSCTVLGFTWAITLLTYLLPPATIWGNLVQGTLTPNQARFLGIGTLVFTLEFALARHLFCRFGCAVGLFQSLAWMANPRGMVVAFRREQARECRTCGARPTASPAWPADAPDAPRSPEARMRAGSACDDACPMRLHPRNIKRMMFSCVQCGRCLAACETSQVAQHRAPLLQWEVGEDAVRETLRQRRAELAHDRGQDRARADGEGD